VTFAEQSQRIHVEERTGHRVVEEIVDRLPETLVEHRRAVGVAEEAVE
jgi:hypothetical protein